LGIYGSAWATFISYFVMAISLFIIVQKIYPVKYEYPNLAKIGISTLICFALYKLINLSLIQLTPAILKLIFLGLFFILTLNLKVLSRGK